MTVNNTNSVHITSDGTRNRRHSFHHTDDLEPHGHSEWRKHSFNVILPRKLSEHTAIDLRLMLVSLKNVSVASAVHILRIERELEKRGCCSSVLGRHDVVLPD
ncbi:MAG: hypothetical protein RTV31_15290 [Candidatus Thorarchaeota archaeon]